MKKKPKRKVVEPLKKLWESKWPDALSLWSSFIKLREPKWCVTFEEEKKERLTGSFAMIRLVDQRVVISLNQIAKLDLEEYPLEIMGHEIGHHVYCPADLADEARLIARIRKAIPTKEHLAGSVSNLYSDLMINNRLQRIKDLNMAGVFKTLAGASDARMWTFYMRIYEILWSLGKNSLMSGFVTKQIEADAMLGARLIRAYAKNWIDGVGRFAALCFPYLMEDEGTEVKKILASWHDMEGAGHAGMPDGLTEIDIGEEAGAIHPSLDPDLTGLNSSANAKTTSDALGGIKSTKKYREPREYGEIMKALDPKADDHEITIKYYRERALPYLVRFPVKETQQASDFIPEGTDVWDVGSSVNQIDWIDTVLTNPIVIPGTTTRERIYGSVDGSEPERIPVDLFLGVDCSGSMINPQTDFSPVVLAGTIIALSALRAGSRVMVCLSGEVGKTVVTDGFLKDEHKILHVLTGYLGTGTTFGIHRLDYILANKLARPVHTFIVTDTDIFDFLDLEFVDDPKAKQVLGKTVIGWELIDMTLKYAGGGGTFILHMEKNEKDHRVQRMIKQGWKVHQITEWEHIIEFAKKFSRENYEKVAVR